MKLKEFRVREFRSIWDSGPVEVDDQVTCLVGKNEAGKTALLTALYRTNPIIPEAAIFEETYDYPKREVEDYKFAVANKEREKAVVVTCLYVMEKSDIEAVTSVFGSRVLKDNTLTRETYYGEENSKFQLMVNEPAARKHLSESHKFSIDIRQKLRSAVNWDDFVGLLNSVEDAEQIKSLKELVVKVQNGGLASYICDHIIWPRAPRFLYFDEYYQMKGQENLNSLIERSGNNKLEDSDRPLIGLINLARLDLKQLVETKNTVDLKNKLEGAGNHLTNKITKYWSQNQHIQIRFDVRDAKPEDPQGMRNGINIWGEVYDTVHWAHTSLGTRSRGFVWFFSFLAWYEDIKRKRDNVILLLDEPGLSLHGRAQADLLRYFEEELSPHQLIYSTHSPFMIDSEKFARVRIVQDLGIDAKERLPKDQDGTKVLSNVFDATNDSLFPLQGALGYEIYQTLFVGPNSLVVEGPSDMLYLWGVSAQLERDGRNGLSGDWVITPVGGAGKVPTFVALLAPQRGLNVVTLLDIHDSDRPLIEDLYKKKLLKKRQVITYGTFVGKNDADVEDMFDRDFYVSIVNAEFAKELKQYIEPAILNPKEPRTLRAIEAWLEENPLKYGTFGHYRPARYFSENVAKLWPEMSKASKERFETAFNHLNALLRRSTTD